MRIDIKLANRAGQNRDVATIVMSQLLYDPVKAVFGVYARDNDVIYTIESPATVAPRLVSMSDASIVLLFDDESVAGEFVEWLHVAAAEAC